MLDIAEALGIKPKALMITPPKEWTLADFRVASGFHQADVTRGFSVTPTRLSSLELGYEGPRPDEIEALAAAYATTPAKLRAAWRRTRARLLESD